MYEGKLASFYPRSIKHVSLMFHTGASLPDPTGLLGEEGDTSRVARVLDEADLDARPTRCADWSQPWIEMEG